MLFFTPSCFCRSPTDKTYLLVGIRHRYQRVTVAAESLFRRFVLPIFADHVVQVFFLRTQKQMARIYATWYITLMANIDAIRNWPAKHFVGDARGYLGATSNANFPVPLVIESTRE
jgi:hypothetical protein